MVEGLTLVSALAAAASALAVIMSRDIMRAALALILTLLALAGVYAGLGAYFLAAVQVIVYAGGIMVLFLFVMMVLKSRREPVFGGGSPRLYRAAAWLAGGLMLVSLLGVWEYGIGGKYPGTRQAGPSLGEIAGFLFGEYVLPFELVGLLLFVTLVAVMALARRDDS